MEHTPDTLNNPRRNALDAMKKSVTPSEWKRNTEFCESLKLKLRAHPMCQHPVLALLREGRLSLNAVQLVHLEYRHAIVQVFTDALLMAQAQARQIEPRLPPGAKMAPRFLLTLNVLDEFGFCPGLDRSGYYRGSPQFAHYPLFESVLDDLGISPRERADYSPSGYASELQSFLQAAFFDYLSVLALLAAAEEQVIIFSPALRQAAAGVGADVGTGYYHVHGTSGQEGVDAHDDDHEDDLWAALTQALTPNDFARIEQIVLAYLDLWTRFWDHQQSSQERANVDRRALVC